MEKTAPLTPLQAREVLELASERSCDPRSCLPQSYPVLARAGSLDQERLSALAQDPRVAHTIAERPDLTPEATRIAFQTDGCALNLAHNPACPEELLQGLYEKNPQTAWAILQNPAASSELLHQMALRENDAWLLHDLARHPNASLSTLGHLAESAEPGVAQEARSVLMERLEQIRERGLACEP